MRKTSIITITDDNRDKGKVFVVTEMAAREAERWAMRFVLALQRGGVQIPDDVARLGFVGIATAVGSQMIGGLKSDEVEPLLDALMRCVQVMPNPAAPMALRPLVDLGIEGDDVEEVATRIRLKMEVIALHTGFSSRGELLSWISEQAQGTTAASQTTGTSPASSAP